MGMKGLAEVEADMYLLNFKTYEEYFSSLLKPIDFFYLRSPKVVEQLAKLGYKFADGTLTREAFLKRLAAVQELLHPHKQHERVSADFTQTDPVLTALMTREKANRHGKLHTIIFIRVVSRIGTEVSGYIDYAQRLRSQSWAPIFRGEKLLRPRVTDLGYYNWSIRYLQCTNSENYKIILDPIKGLLFQSNWDHLVFSVHPNMKSPGPNTVRSRYKSPRYLNVTLYDHRVRRKC